MTAETAKSVTYEFGNNFSRSDYDKKLKCYVSEREEVAYVDVEYNSKPRSTAIRVIHARNTQYFLTALLIFDVILLFGQVFLDAHFPPCYAITANAECVDVNGVESDTAHVHCEEHPYAVESVAVVMYFASLIILSIFEIELVALVLTLGPVQYLRNLSYWLDTFIINVSIVLEVVLHETKDDALASALVVARVWRLIRISHGIFTTKRRQLMASIVAGQELVKSEPWEEVDSEEEEEDSRQYRKSRVASVPATSL
mmetsp:Transcript_14270/g.23180  ORF Transcript_14270/g.23180 Transcript_14270/m.23180 type:complete len:256 (+) Transcript_14270:106-873(+)|eukprot:CAMPEP_0171533596 /NCGR_PEP_ID=MMETSP0959-20130129/15771_1 /TAXON_ID=87120 /ORGANISM="Aurantiochytrium limacinum, Strain ATCCMYA-1381" /LENGTH=255 /DNA_ID=CAMNT_0012078617 /DNA_START=158 /DNA_END=925 /DNA_ORIENTATION=+